MPLHDARRIPLATYRLQLHSGFSFDDAAKRIEFFQAIGISDLYCSPIFRAAPGSQHGYDVADYRKINPELGGGEAFFRLIDQLAARGMGVVLDFVPNHMGIQGPFNVWWRDVLESGALSPYSTFFDIHWNRDREPSGRARVLVPILGAHYGEELEQGKLSIVYANGAFSLAYADLRFPINPDTYPAILKIEEVARDISGPAHVEFLDLTNSFGSLPAPDPIEEPLLANARSQQIEHLKRRLATLLDQTPKLKTTLENRLATLNGKPGDPRSFDELDAILEKQHYRMARWKAGVHEINYRRFFAVDSLVGLRMENPHVFHESHLLLRHLVKEGRVQGLRIDHIDGLWDPQEYLERLQSFGTEPGVITKPLYVLVEKIRERHEELPEAWATHGTTGYEFIAQLAGIFIDPANEYRFTRLYQKITGDRASYEDIVYEKKRLILEETFANAVTMFGTDLADLVSNDRQWRDLTRYELVTAVRELMASMSVYRTYRRGEYMNDADRKVVRQACELALKRNARSDPQPFKFIESVLTGDYPPADAKPEYRDRLWRWTLTFQQYTGAVMAKSLEDTAFYTYCRFVALNEVGGDASVFGTSVEEFHATNLRRLRTSPAAMITTSTHDTKMSEDVRARLYTLSEIPAEWEDWINEWREIAKPFKTEIEGTSAPDPVDEYRIFQILIGSWPLDTEEPNEDYRKRIREHVRKSVNEAKRFTSWINQNEPYLNSCDKFVDALLTRATGDAFLTSFVPRAKRVAHLGMVNSLSQVVLKSTVPGVPDFYQGNTLWDFSLVDPDNRRPVDYQLRESLLATLPTSTPLDLLRNWTDGRIKLWTTQKLLKLRGEFPELFHRGEYSGLTFNGRFQKHVIGFRRNGERISVAVIVPRISAILGCPPTGLVWENTTVYLGQTEADWEDVFTGFKYPANTSVSLIDLLGELPFSVLVNRR
ncbi:MAG TPA: malto-oligosyltrehalose synthase [Opitutaceae bacterium]|nr:malto-oligosyltrehalose synthase [Opitutaceae bacterium]